jgi:hypothetical protein
MHCTRDTVKYLFGQMRNMTTCKTCWNASEKENIGKSRCRWASSIEVEFCLKKQNILETGSASIIK